MAERLLMNEFKQLAKIPWTNIELVDENVLKWNVALIVLNSESPYYGGYYKASMTFPADYPYKPPDFRFLRPLYHPNIYPDGRLCISILHPPGDDELSGELASERWNPAQSVESVLISILSLLDDPEVSSPANVDASVMYRKDRPAFVKRVTEDLEASKTDIPAGFEMPTQETAYKSANDGAEFAMDWADSDDEEEDDFGGSDSDVVEDEDFEFGDDGDEGDSDSGGDADMTDLGEDADAEGDEDEEES